MKESDIGFRPVIQDLFTPTLVGVVTDRDLCLCVVASGRDPSSSWVDACMSNHPIWYSEQDDVSRTLDLMKTHQIRRLPVVNESTKSQAFFHLAIWCTGLASKQMRLWRPCKQSASKFLNKKQ